MQPSRSKVELTRMTLLWGMKNVRQLSHCGLVLARKRRAFKSQKNKKSNSKYKNGTAVIVLLFV